MHLRSGKTLKEMARPTNSGTSASSQSSQSSSQEQSTHASTPTVGANVSTAIWVTMAMPYRSNCFCNCFDNCCCNDTTINGGLLCPHSLPIFLCSTIIHMSPHPQVRDKLDDRFIVLQNFIMPMTTREQPYGMPTSMMASFHNNVSTFADHPIPFTPYNANNPSGSSVFGRNAPLDLTTESMISLRVCLDEGMC